MCVESFLSKETVDGLVGANGYIHPTNPNLYVYESITNKENVLFNLISYSEKYKVEKLTIKTSWWCIVYYSQWNIEDKVKRLKRQKLFNDKFQILLNK